jgi:alkylation response protein AidB-like acyl-CoA dehydrogenase
MDFTDSPDQAALREVVRDFLRQHVTPERVRAAAAEPGGYDAALWKRLSGELGLTSLPVPEALGGAGVGFAEVAVVLEETGRVLAPVPYLSSAVAATLLAAGEPEAARQFLPGLADGTSTAALALDGEITLDGTTVSGTARNVADGAAAALLLVSAGDTLVAVRAADAAIEPVGTLDQTRPQAHVTFRAAPAVAVGVPVDLARDLLRTALAVEAVGAAEHCLAATVAYLKERVQFGRSIGQFQALKHRCADLAVEIESARATARAAVWTAVHDPDSLAVVGPLAKRHCADVFTHVAAEMIQLHGGIGFTWEHEAHLYFKRAKSTQLTAGTPSQLRRLVGERAGLI